MCMDSSFIVAGKDYTISFLTSMGILPKGFIFDTCHIRNNLLTSLVSWIITYNRGYSREWRLCGDLKKMIVSGYSKENREVIQEFLGRHLCRSWPLVSDMIDCHKCKHYYVTWDKDFPHGCRAMDFKSYHLPSSVVYKCSGIDCLMFKLKDRTRHLQPPKDSSNSKRWVDCKHAGSAPMPIRSSVGTMETTKKKAHRYINGGLLNLPGTPR